MKWIWLQDQRPEFICEHGVGHYAVWAQHRVHGCDRCCELPDFPGRQPRYGDVAVCGVGGVGQIHAPQLMDIEYPDGNTGQAYLGRYLWDCEITLPNGERRQVKAGDHWSSRNPCILFNIDEVPEWETLWDFTFQRLVDGWPLAEPLR